MTRTFSEMYWASAAYGRDRVTQALQSKRCTISPVRRNKLFVVLVAVSLLADFAEPRVSAQSAPSTVTSPSFEVASVKPDHSDSGTAFLQTFYPIVSPHVTATNVTVKWLLTLGYGVKDFQLSGTPAWVNLERFDISANIDETQFEQLEKLSRDDQLHPVQLLVQSLLADRFKLKVTRETKELPIMALAAGKNASKLAQFAVRQPSSKPTDLISTGFGSNGLRIVKGVETSMHNLAGTLGAMLQQQIVDQTGISGYYTFALTWTDAVQADPNAASDSGPSLQTALEDQLGLKLESTKGPVDTIVIDHIEEPSPN